MVLSNDDVEQYRKEGFLLVRQALDEQLIGRLSNAANSLWEQSRTQGKKDGHFDLAPGHGPDSPSLRRVSSPNELDQTFVDVAFDSVAADITAELIGRPIKFYHAKLNFKLPQSDATQIQWHQDWTHFPHTNFDLLAISIPLQARTVENGCIRFVPRSHERGPLSTWRDGTYVFTCEDSLSEEDMANAVPVESEPGDILFHHGLMVHGSDANRTAQLCATYTVQYAAADAFAFTAPVIDSIHRNRMVRGEAPRHARLEAGVIELPPDFSAGYGSLFASQDKARAS